jgi:hypothetical protein
MKKHIAKKRVTKKRRPVRRQMPKRNTSVACIVLNWNGGGRILSCLKSIRDSKGVSTVTFVLDNGSLDGSRGHIPRVFPEAKVRDMGRNAGLVKGRNEGAKWALGEGFPYLLFIDDDAVLADGALALMRNVLEADPQCGLVTPRIFGKRGSDVMWYDGGEIDFWGDPVHRGFGEPVQGEPIIRNEAFATGCCVLIRREVFERIGFLNEDYFVYSEDVDFSLRARDAGFTITHVPSAHAWHLQSGDTRFNVGRWYRDYYVTRNKFLLFRTHYHGGRRTLAMTYSTIRWGLLPMMFFGFRGEIDRSKATALALVDAIRGRFGGRYS